MYAMMTWVVLTSDWAVGLPNTQIKKQKHETFQAVIWSTNGYSNLAFVAVMFFCWLLLLLNKLMLSFCNRLQFFFDETCASTPCFGFSVLKSSLINFYVSSVCFVPSNPIV